MAKRINASTLNASTTKILNTIRQNASFQYQSLVPSVTKLTDIPKVGEVICGTPALTNEFLNALVNRIAIVSVKSAIFNNPYSRLKKGFIEFGETIEEIFVNIAKVSAYDVNKASAREFRRSVPDVKSAFHAMNWRVLYPVTVQDDDLKRAFLSADGVSDLISKIVDSVYRAAEYDEFLLFKYLLIKAVSSGKAYPVSIGSGNDLKESAIQFRGVSNALTFMNSKYNPAGVKTTTPKNKQVIFMDSFFNAQYDVDVLAGAFNMDKAEYIGALELIDDFTTFDNERFESIRQESTEIDSVTPEELSLMAGVKAILVDEDFFQIYDNMTKFTEKFVASGDYWNYFLHTWKTVSYSPFANIAVFVTDTSLQDLPDTFECNIASIDKSSDGMTFVLVPEISDIGLTSSNYRFMQTRQSVIDSIAIDEYGAITVPGTQLAGQLSPALRIGTTTYTAQPISFETMKVGDKVTFSKFKG